MSEAEDGPPTTSMARAASEKDTTLARRYAAATADAANVFFLPLLLLLDVIDRDVVVDRAWEAAAWGAVKDSEVPMEIAAVARKRRVDFMVAGRLVRSSNK